MGLDITFHIGSQPCTDEEAAEISGSKEPRDLAYDLGLRMPWAGDYASRCADLTAVAYRDERTMHVYMSYGGYSRWREGLAVLAGVDVRIGYPDNIDPLAAHLMGIKPRPMLDAFWSECTAIEERGETPPWPFWQLINFSDCEGAIGPSVCKSLADDFDRFAEKATVHLDDDWRRLYSQLRDGLRAVVDSGGWVEFH